MSTESCKSFDNLGKRQDSLQNVHNSTMLQQMPLNRYYNDIIDSKLVNVMIFRDDIELHGVGSADFSTPREQIYFPDIGGLSPSLAAVVRRRVKSFSRVGHQDSKGERITSASSWVDVGRSVGRAVSGFWFLLLSSAHTFCIYIHIIKRPWIDGSAICPVHNTHIHTYI